MTNTMEAPDCASYRCPDGLSPFQHFSFQLFSFYKALATQSVLPEPPFFPPSGLRHLLRRGYEGQEGYDRQAGPAQRLFQGPPQKSKFLATVGTAIAKRGGQGRAGHQRRHQRTGEDFHGNCPVWK